MKKLVLIVLILSVILLVGCGGSIDKQNSLNWWGENEDVALKILKLFKSSPLIDRVEIDTRKELISNYEKFDDKTWKVYRSIEKVMRNKEIEVVTSYYFDDSYILEMTLDRYGYAIGESEGCYSSVVYYSNVNIYEKMVKDIVYTEKLKPNWYLEINGDKNCIR